MQESNKRIAKNTLVIYARIIVTMVVGLFTSRYVLQSLGASDFGLYNVVGSVIGMYGFISASLSSTTTRFLNFEMGKKDGDVNKMFNICLVLHMAMAVLILIISESFGIWYINNHLNVTVGKEFDAIFCFQVSILVSCIGIINVPYQSLFQAHEKFLFMALVDIGFAFVRLAFVVMLIFYKGNALLFYATYMALLSLASMLIYHYLSRKKWPQYERWKFVAQWKRYKEVLSFNGYTFLHTASMSARNAGSNLLINMFFGTVVNAAFAIAKSVEGYVETFMATFDSAAGPQVTQSFSQGNWERTNSLVNRICKISILLSIILFVPLYLEIDFFLMLWLGNPPEGSSVFARLILIQIVVSSTSGGIGTLINALGKIKWFKIEISVLFLLCLPIGYVLFRQGYPAEMILVLFILSDVINRIIELMLLRKIVHYDVKRFIREAYYRPIALFFILLLYMYIYETVDMDMVVGHIIGFLLSGVICLVIVYVIGLDFSERKYVKQIVYKKIKR